MLSKLIKDPHCIWISSPHNLGDFIAKIPLIKILKSHFPKVKIVVAARSYVKDIISLIPQVDLFIDFEKFFDRAREEIEKEFQELKVDTLIHLLSQQKDLGPPVLDYAKKAGIPNRIGNVYRSWLTLKLKNKQSSLTHNLRKPRIIRGIHEYQWNLFPLSWFGLRSEYSLKEISQLLQTDIIPFKKSPFIKEGLFNLIIHPGSLGNAKEWPKKNYQELLLLLKERPINLIITGSDKEAITFKDFEKLANNVTFAMGKCSLQEFIALISQCDGLIAGSTGPIHIASLFGVPTLALFPKQWQIGPSIWAPLGSRASYLEASAICKYCENKLADFNPNLCQCMQSIQPLDVLTQINPWFSYENIVR